MLYACEVWGPDDTGLADKLLVRFLKIALGLKINTPTLMILGETGVFPLSCEITKRVIHFWLKMSNDESISKIASCTYNIMFKMLSNDIYKCRWLLYIKNNLDSYGIITCPL